MKTLRLALLALLTVLAFSSNVWSDPGQKGEGLVNLPNNNANGGGMFEDRSKARILLKVANVEDGLRFRLPGKMDDGALVVYIVENMPPITMFTEDVLVLEGSDLVAARDTGATKIDIWFSSLDGNFKLHVEIVFEEGGEGATIYLY